MRRPVKKRPATKPDPRHGSERVERLINYIMLDGKKSAARKVVYGALEELKTRDGVGDPLEVLDTALKNIEPLMEVRSRRVGGANYQVPREVRSERRSALGLRWLVQATRAKSGSPMSKRLADELIAASKGEGMAVKKREDTHRMAEANRAFAHFAW